jgi:hypothetical protein
MQVLKPLVQFVLIHVGCISLESESWKPFNGVWVHSVGARLCAATRTGPWFLAAFMT